MITKKCVRNSSFTHLELHSPVSHKPFLTSQVKPCAFTKGWCSASFPWDCLELGLVSSGVAKAVKTRKNCNPHKCWRQFAKEIQQPEQVHDKSVNSAASLCFPEQPGAQAGAVFSRWLSTSSLTHQRATRPRQKFQCGEGVSHEMVSEGNSRIKITEPSTMQNINLLPCVILACITGATLLRRRCSAAQKDYGSGCQIAGTPNTCAFNKLAENS